jgi:hypothetical protein
MESDQVFFPEDFSDHLVVIHGFFFHLTKDLLKFRIILNGIQQGIDSEERKYDEIETFLL